MFRESAARLLVPAIRNALQQRAQSVVAAPSRVKVSTAEKVVLGGGMTFAMLIIPGWVLYKIPTWRGAK